ncbi:MAG TPA: adenylate/guanylate cyclase domain-containing protein [Gaiellaceae bacterium]|jgi:class 3 adenylate cyclase
MELPETRYASSGDVSIAYQVVGEGPFDLVYAPPFISHVELAWEIPTVAAHFRRLASFCRLIRFDKRGTGMSDRVGTLPTLETRMDDLRAVMDAAGSERAAIMGVSEGGSMAILFAATYPERAWALVLEGAFARTLWAPDYAWGVREQEFERELSEEMQGWGTREHGLQIARELAPSASHEDWEPLATMIRQGASPGAARDLELMSRQIDVRHALPAIQVPTLVLNRTDEHPFQVASAQHLAEQISHARHVQLPGSDHLLAVGDPEGLADRIHLFLAETWAELPEGSEPSTVLATVLFTDIVGSTEKMAELGDRRWRELLHDHHNAVRRQLARFRGVEMDTAGDGFFARFDGPGRAIQCAQAITAAVAQLGIQVRAGLHTGECEVADGKVAGIAVSIGARIASAANPSEVLVSSTVKDLVAGSGLTFDDRGTHQLKGVPGAWRLYSVVAST